MCRAEPSPTQGDCAFLCTVGTYLPNYTVPYPWVPACVKGQSHHPPSLNFFKNSELTEQRQMANTNTKT
jgi:hypothetical protein